MPLELKLAQQGAKPKPQIQELPEGGSHLEFIKSKSKPGQYQWPGFFYLFILSLCLSLSTQLVAETELPLTQLTIQPGAELNINWEHSQSYQIQLPTKLKGNWLLSVEQRGVDVTPTLIDREGNNLIAIDAAILAVGIERLALSAAELNGTSLQLPKKTRITSPGGVTVRLQEIHDLELFAMLRQIMAGTAYLHHRQASLPTTIDCTTDISEFGKDPGLAARCFKAAGENYQPQFAAVVSIEELDYFLADSARRLGLVNDSQRLYLPLIRQQQNLRIQALALHGLAWTVWQAGEHKVGESFARQAEERYQSWLALDPENRGISYQLLAVRNIACLILHDQELLDRAEACYLELLPVVQLAVDQATENLLVGNLGGIYYRRGDIAQARAQFEKSRIRAVKMGDLGGQVRALSTIGLTEMRAGNLQAALKSYQQAVLLAPGSTAASRIEGFQMSIASIYRRLGDGDRASALYLELEPKALSRGDKQDLLYVYGGLARIEKTAGRSAAARVYFLQVLELERQLGRATWVAEALLALAELEMNTANLTAANHYLLQAAEYLPEVETFVVRTWAKLLQGRYALLSGNYPAAIDQFQTVLAAYRKEGNLYNQAQVNLDLATAYTKVGEWTDAETATLDAIALLSKMRPENISLDLRASFSGIQRQAYTKLVELYLHRWQLDGNSKWSRQALFWAERARGQTLREATMQLALAENLSPALRQQRQDLNDRLNAIATMRLKAQEKTTSEQVAEGKAGIRANLDRRYEKALSALEAFDQQYLPARKQAEVTLNLELVQASLPADTAALIFYLGANTGALWLLTATGLETRLLPPADEIGSRVEKLRLALRRPGGYREVMAELAWLGELMDPRLPETFTKVQIVADMELNYLPFAVLPLAEPGSGNWLQRYTLSYSPYLGVLKPAAATWGSIKIFADPAYDQAEVQQLVSKDAENTWPADFGLYRLRGSAVEAKTIADLAREYLPATAGVEVLTGRRATRKEVLEQSRADILHFATHGIFAANASGLSGLALAVADTEGRQQPWLLTAQELYHTPLAANLIVMSACDTGTGKLKPGEGLLGLVRGFMYAGVEAVVSSQWKVSDRAAVALMERFYHEFLAKRLPVAAALRQAQLEFLTSERHSDPFYWAGFTYFQQPSKQGEKQYVSQSQ